MQYALCHDVRSMFTTIYDALYNNGRQVNRNAQVLHGRFTSLADGLREKSAREIFL